MYLKQLITLIILLSAASSYAGILIQKKSDLIFNPQGSEASGSFTIGASNTPDSRGEALVKKGTSGESAIATIVESSVQLTHTDTSTLTVNNFVISENVPFDSKGNLTLRVGGTISLSGTSSAGTYSGSCTLRVYPETDPSDVVEVSIPISQVIIGAISITEVSPLTFSNVVTGVDNTTTILTTDANAAEFSSTGEGGYSITTSVNQSSITLTNEFSDEITVDTFTVSSCSSYGPTGDCSSIKVGATVHAPSNTPSGTYSGSATLKIIYL